MARTESVGQENYRTHKFVEFKVAAPHYDAAKIEAQQQLQEIQDVLKELYVLHMVVQADLNSFPSFIIGKGIGTKRVIGKKVAPNDYLFNCAIFARAVRAENNQFKHIRQREIHELDTFAKGYYVGLSLKK